MKVVRWVLAGMVIAGSVRGAPPVTFNTHSVSTTEPADSRAAEAAFLQAVANGGFAAIGEDFEDPVWAITRAPGAATSVTHQGVTWHSSPGNQIRTVSDSDSYDIPPPFMVYVPDGFRTFQVLEFAGEFDEVVLMWARTFTFAVAPEPVLRLTGMERLPAGLVIDVLADPAFSNLTLQGNDTAIDPGAWTLVPGDPVSVGPHAFRLVAPLPTGPVTLYRIIADVREVLP